MSINEIVFAVTIVLGSIDVDVCPAADRDGDQAVAIAELVAVVTAALGGCSVPL